MLHMLFDRCFTSCYTEDNRVAVNGGNGGISRHFGE